MPTPRKFNLIMARAEAGAELSEAEMVSAVMSLIAGKRQVSRGGPKKRWKICPKCRGRVYAVSKKGLVEDWKRHVMGCGVAGVEEDK